LKNAVIFNGGRGASSLIPALLSVKDFKVSSIVNAYDDGKSTGQIRDFFGMLGPSDLRKVQQLMVSEDNPDFNSINKIFDYRFPSEMSNAEIIDWIESECCNRENSFFKEKFESKDLLVNLRFFLRSFLESYRLIIKSMPSKNLNLVDGSLMNCLYAGAFIHFKRNIEDAAFAFETFLSLSGSVLPTNIENKKLVGLRSDGTILFNEAEIVELRSNVDIERVYVVDEYPQRDGFHHSSFEEKKHYFEMHQCFVEATPRVVQAIQDADIIIYAAGTQHSSLYPTYLSSGIPAAITANTHALKVFITNIGADYETPFYKAHDYVKGALKYLNLGNNKDHSLSSYFTHVLVNENNSVTSNPNYVAIDEAALKYIDVNIIRDNFEDGSTGKHDGKNLVNLIQSLYSSYSK